MRAVVAATLLSLAAVASAPAATIVGGEGEPLPPPRLQKWADSALVPTPDVEITVHMRWCDDVPTRPACAKPGEIWIAPDVMRRLDFRHELGHQFDYFLMTDEARKRFLAIMRDDREWRSAPESPHERFAEAWRLCAAARRLPQYYNVAYGLELTPRQFHRVCALIRGVAAGGR